MGREAANLEEPTPRRERQPGRRRFPCPATGGTFTPMTEAAVEMKVAGQTYRVVTSASAQELGELAATVEHALYEVTPPGRQPSPDALILAAVTLAHELREEQARRRAQEEQHKKTLAHVLSVIDDVLGPQEHSHNSESPFRDGNLGEEVTAIARRRTSAHTASKNHD
jgi:cell division protein ZapA